MTGLAMEVRGGALISRNSEFRQLESRGISPDAAKELRMPFLKNQNPSNDLVHCCVSAAFTVCMEFDLLEKYSVEKELSMLFHYHYGGKKNPSRGMTIDEGIKVAKSRGVCIQSAHDLDISSSAVAVTPSPQAVVNGLTRRLVTYQKLAPTNIENWKTQLRAGRPLILVFYLYSEIFSEIPGNNYTHPPVNGPLPSSGHCVVVVGFNESKKQFLIQDCRGSSWAEEGRWYLPYSLAKSLTFSNSVMVVRKIKRGRFQ